jgi:hypothetical protein
MYSMSTCDGFVGVKSEKMMVPNKIKLGSQPSASVVVVCVDVTVVVPELVEVLLTVLVAVLVRVDVDVVLPVDVTVELLVVLKVEVTVDVEVLVPVDVCVDVMVAKFMLNEVAA